MQITQGVRQAVQNRGSATATVFGERRRSWKDLQDRVSRYAGGLKALGLQAGDRVAIIAHNSDLYIESYYAVAWAGGVLVPGNFRWSTAEHIYALKDSGARFLLLDSSFESLAAPLSDACDFAAVLLLEADDIPTRNGLVRTEDLIRAHQTTADASGEDDDLCVIFYTGGTTGRSKGVMLSHRNLISNILAVNAMAPFPPEPIFLHTMPMFHLAAAGAVLAVTMYAGTHVVHAGFNAENVIKTIESERVTATASVPTMFAILREHLQTHSADLSSVRRIRYGAAGITESLLRDAMQMFANAEFQQGYGQTEMSPCVTVLEPRFHKANDGKPYLRSAGRPIIGTDVRIVDENLRDRPLGQVGEIVARGPGVMLGYWNRPDLTAATIIDGWVRTGDAGYMDEDGFIFIADRIKDMIVSGGENIYSAEVENALQAHPAVAECAVIGIPDLQWGERVHAFVRFKEGVSAETQELVDHCKILIASYKCPRSIEVREEPLPSSAQGKILKSELRKPYWEGRQRKVG